MWHVFAFLLLTVACKNAQNPNTTPVSTGFSSQSAAIVRSQSGVATLAQDANETQLQQMSMSALQALYTQRKDQDTSDAHELQLKTALSAAMCQQYQQMNTTCISLLPLVPSQYTQSIACNGNLTASTAAPQTIQVTVSGTATGQFVLVANNQTNMTPFQSTPFGTGTSTITFYQVAGRAISPPTFGSISTLYIESATNNSNLPPMTNFNNFMIKINGKALLQADLLPYTDTDYATTRYNVPLDAVTQLQRSATCSMSQTQVAALTQQITTNVTSQQAASAEQAYQANTNSTSTLTNTMPSDKNGLIAAVTELETSITTRQPVLEQTSDTLLKLTNAMTQNQNIGCHYNDIITSIQVRVNGDQPGATANLVGNISDAPTNPSGTGGCNDILIDFGSVSQTFDQDNDSIFAQNQLEFPPNSATIGSLSFIHLKKARICYQGEEQFHTEDIILSSTDWNVYEIDIFNITGVEVTINGTLLYKNDNLSLSLRGPTTYGQGTYTLEWNDGIQDNNPLWTAFMNQQDCSATK